MAKLPSGTTARAVEEWRGASPDAKVPERVKLRIFERQGGRCAITGREFRPGDDRRLDHKVPLADGGMHAEQNLQWILDDEAHKPKTAAEAAARAKVRRVRKAHHGIKAPPARPLQGRGFDQVEKEPAKVLETVDGLPGIFRRFR